MKNNKAKMFLTALDILAEHTTNLRDAVNLSTNQEDAYVDGDVMDVFDEALMVVLQARNEFCAEEDMATEDGEIHWTKSDAMKADDLNNVPVGV